MLKQARKRNVQQILCVRGAVELGGLQKREVDRLFLNGEGP
jgi:hypothetical protein